MNRLSLAALTALTALAAPLSAFAVAPNDPYADAIFSVSNQLLTPANALGAPDGSYADYLRKDASAVFDMGEGEEGTGDLVLTMKPLNFGASYWVDFMDASFLVLESKGDFLPLDSDEEVVTYTGSTPYRYVRIESIKEEVWRLDSMRAASTVAAPADALNPPLPTPPLAGGEAEATSVSSPRGLLLKVVDDQNPVTETDSIVYSIGADGKRHAMPSFSVFNTWYADFNDLAYIDIDHLATYALGKNVTVRPGTNLVKITTDPKVYAVEPGGVLRWITSESIAIHLYGASWAKRVIDVPDTFFGNYTLGEPIFAEIHPNGSVGVLPSGEVVYIDNATAHTIPGDVHTDMRFNPDFFVPINNTQEALYGHGVPLTSDANLRFPY